MFNLYSFKNSGSKFSNDMESNTSSTNSYASNPNTINAAHTSVSAEAVDDDCTKNSKSVNVLNDNKFNILENRKSKKLKTNLIDRFNGNTGEDRNESSQLTNIKNQAKKNFNNRVKII